MAKVNRVHWIRARARQNRWQEEVTLTHYEMQWTVRYFQNQACKWKQWGVQAEQGRMAGAAAYAARKVAMWTDMAGRAYREFKLINQTLTVPDM